MTIEMANKAPTKNEKMNTKTTRYLRVAVIQFHMIHYIGNIYLNFTYRAVKGETFLIIWTVCPKTFKRFQFPLRASRLCTLHLTIYTMGILWCVWCNVFSNFWLLKCNLVLQNLNLSFHIIIVFVAVFCWAKFSPDEHCLVRALTGRYTISIKIFCTLRNCDFLTFTNGMQCCQSHNSRFWNIYFVGSIW